MKGIKESSVSFLKKIYKLKDKDQPSIFKKIYELNPFKIDGALQNPTIVISYIFWLIAEILEDQIPSQKTPSSLSEENEDLVINAFIFGLNLLKLAIENKLISNEIEIITDFINQNSVILWTIQKYQDFFCVVDNLKRASGEISKNLFSFIQNKKLSVQKTIKQPFSTTKSSLKIFNQRTITQQSDITRLPFETIKELAEISIKTPIKVTLAKKFISTPLKESDAYNEKTLISIFFHLAEQFKNRLPATPDEIAGIPGQSTELIDNIITCLKRLALDSFKPNIKQITHCFEKFNKLIDKNMLTTLDQGRKNNIIGALFSLLRKFLSLKPTDQNQISIAAALFRDLIDKGELGEGKLEMIYPGSLYFQNTAKESLKELAELNDGNDPLNGSSHPALRPR